MTQTSAPAPTRPNKPKIKYRRVRTPTVLQMEAVECGAAALGMVLSYYDKIVPLDELRVACGVSRDGSKAAKILKAARNYGMVAKGFRKEMEALYETKLPAILFWEFNHFVVLEGFDKHWVYLNDPATGPRTVSYEEFDQSFTGVVLEIEPGPDFKKSGQHPSLLRALQKRLVGSELALTYVTLVGLALILPGMVVPLFSRVFVDYYLVNNFTEVLWPLLGGMALTAVLRLGLTWLQQNYLLRLQTRLAVSMSGKFFWHVLHLPINYYAQRFAGEIGSRVALNDVVAGLLSERLASAALDVFVATFFLILMLLYNVPLTLIGLGFAAVNIVALRYVSRKRKDLNRHLLQEQGKTVGVAMGGLRLIETLKATGRESDFFARWAGYYAKSLRVEQSMQVFTLLLLAVPPFLMALNTATILIVGGWLVTEGQLTLGGLVAFQSLMLSFLTPTNKLVELGSIFQEVEGDLARLDDVLSNQPDETLTQAQNAPLPRQLPKLEGQLEFRNVTFGYSRLDPPLIENFSLTLKPGSRVALVGSSGSGKSTVAKLASGLYEPWEGEILLDGKPRNEVARITLTNSLTVVDQDVFLFEGSVSDNLTLWDPTVPEVRVIQAARDAAIHDDLAARAGGYNSRVAEGGTNFSGGQRQRLEIARALVSDPAILVLDEATSALDTITEKRIDENLRRRGCTCLIIAHRLSTIRDCDEIIVMQNGKIVQRGTHLEMRDEEGLYARLIGVG